MKSYYKGKAMDKFLGKDQGGIPVDQIMASPRWTQVYVLYKDQNLVLVF